MMMKIFGAVLIVSSGYILGRIRTLRWKQRLKALKELHDLILEYSGALAEFRLSFRDFLSDQGTMGRKILDGEGMDGLAEEDQVNLNDMIRMMKTTSFQEALSACRTYLSNQEILIQKIEEEVGSSGKAFPLVTGAFGFLVAVFLF